MSPLENGRRSACSGLPLMLVFGIAMIMYATSPSRRDLHRLVDRRVEDTQIDEHAAGGDDALAGLPHLVVDDEHAVVAGGRQLPPRIAVEHLRRAVLGGGGVERHVDDVT